MRDNDKMKNLSSKILFFLSLQIIFSVFAQSNVIVLSDAEFVVQGTSTLRKWETKTIKAEGKGSIILENNQMVKINELTISLPADEIKSGNKTMDNHANKALKAKEYPTIYFTLTEVPEIKKHGEIMVIIANGNLEIAGEKKLITIIAESKTEYNKLFFQGETKLKMTDFKMKPPVFLGGAMKTGDEVTVKFKTVFNF